MLYNGLSFRLPSNSLKVKKNLQHKKQYSNGKSKYIYRKEVSFVRIIVVRSDELTERLLSKESRM